LDLYAFDFSIKSKKLKAAFYRKSLMDCAGGAIFQADIVRPYTQSAFFQKNNRLSPVKFI